MKQYIKFGFLIFLSLLLVACTRTTGNTVLDSPTQANIQDSTLAIEGMTCKSCALGVEYELKQVNGVLDAKINYETGKGLVTYDANLVDANTIAKASTAYPAKVIN